ncbi:four helix bundle protein [candidate division WOR-3 bacterium]|nr:four helix bundle protein [candidate division WOR-3 bacterium]
MKKLRSFKDLVVWQLASGFSKDMAILVKTFPKKEQYALADDLVRAARSVPANISEGWGRLFPKEKIVFYNIANGSIEECSNHLTEAYNNRYIDEVKYTLYQKKAHVIAVKITNLITSTRKRIKSSAAQRRVSKERSL